MILARCCVSWELIGFDLKVEEWYMKRFNSKQDSETQAEAEIK